MTLVAIVVVLVGAVLMTWLINSYIPIPSTIKSLLNVVVFVVLAVWLLQGFGLVGSIPGVHVPTLR